MAKAKDRSQDDMADTMDSDSSYLSQIDANTTPLIRRIAELTGVVKLKTLSAGRQRVFFNFLNIIF